MEIVTWNVGRRRASLLDALVRERAPDILTLQEITPRQARFFGERLSAMGLKFAHYSGRADVIKKRYGNMIASRYPLKPVEIRFSRSHLPWPQAIAQVEVAIDDCPTVIITAHMPNGSRNGWAKIDTFLVLNELVREARDKPCIVTGDFNEPRIDIQDGRVTTFGQDRNRSGQYVCWGEWRGRTGAHWDSAVRWIFENREEHGLRHAYWDAHGSVKTDESHVTRSGNRRWFDHIFVSTHFRVESCAYLHDLRLSGVSDHSALAARLEFSAGRNPLRLSPGLPRVGESDRVRHETTKSA